MNAPILMFTQGALTWASSRFRGYWLQDVAPDLFELHRRGQIPDLADRKVVVFQKRHGDSDLTMAREAQHLGIKVVYDLTDPLWWFDPERVTAMLAVADLVTASSEGLAEAVRDIPVVKQVAVIPDRMLPAFHPTVREHADHRPVTLVWFGQSINRVTLAGPSPVLTYLANLGMEFRLRVVDDAPNEPFGVGASYPVEMVPWVLETFHANLTDSDIALIPPYPGPWGQMKSDNKTATAWWAGLPVTDGHDPDELKMLIENVDERARQGRENRARAEAEYGIERSVAEWRALLEMLAAEPEAEHAPGD